MKSKLILILAGISALAVAGYLSVRSWMKKLKFGIKPTEMSLSHIGWDAVEIILPIWIYNPTPLNIIVTGMNIKVYIQGTYLATLTSNNKYMIKSKIASEYPVLISLPTSDLLKVLSEHGTAIDDPNWKSKVKLAVQGSVSLESGVVVLNNLKLDFDDTLQGWMG